MSIILKSKNLTVILFCLILVLGFYVFSIKANPGATIIVDETVYWEAEIR